MHFIIIIPEVVLSAGEMLYSETKEKPQDPVTFTLNFTVGKIKVR